MDQKVVLSRLIGQLPAALANAVSEAIQTATDAGMETNEAVSVVVAVAADYGRRQYGARYLEDLSGVVLAGASLPRLL